MKRVLLALVVALTFPAAAQSFETRPRSDLTPGLVRTDLTITQICRTKWGADARSVTAKMKQDVVASYNFKVSSCPLTLYKGKKVRRMEIDHLVARSLGGADDVRNLWPECYEPVNKNKSLQADGAHKKDRLETYLHQKVCNPRSETLLKEYQGKLKRDWLALYHEIYGDN